MVGIPKYAPPGKLHCMYMYKMQMGHFRLLHGSYVALMIILFFSVNVPCMGNHAAIVAIGLKEVTFEQNVLNPGFL